jgi:hypothetical protein
MQPFVDKFNSIFEIVKMNRNSITVRDRKDGSLYYLHRNAYNAILDGTVVDFRIGEPIHSDFGQMNNLPWIEVLMWKRI